MGLASEFKDFIAKGSVIEIAVGIVIGLAFTALVNAVVQGLVLPLVSVPGSINISSWDVHVRSAVFLPGSVIQSLISFLLIAAVVFFAVIRPLAKMEARRAARKPAAAPTTKSCPECLSDIPIGASRCKFCTAKLT
ncbi:MAG: large conductance mechanosensitive channel protein MscL [Thermoplasmata archaeon]|nr:large conductance mechanosensitive channel protein MscL [Thermoplasmata archaeon]